MSADSDGIRFVICSIEKDSYSLDMTRVRSIQRVERMVPNTEPNGPVGWLPSREGDIPLYRLATQLGLGTERSTKRPMAVVLHAKPKPWALLVEQVSRVNEVGQKDTYPVPPLLGNKKRNFFSSVLKLEDRLSLMLSPDDLLLSGASKPVMPDLTPDEPKKRRKKKKRAGRLLSFVSGAKISQRPVRFALSVTQVAEILNIHSALDVPGAPPHVKGLVEWRSRPVPLLDLPTMLGLERDPDADLRRMLIARTTGEYEFLAFLTHPTVTSLSLPIAHSPFSRGHAWPSGSVRGCVELKNETLIIPDVAGILSSCA